MRSGLIVYLVADGELPEGFDLASGCKEMGFPADGVALVGARDGFFEVDDAWHYLFTRGYGDIKLLVAQSDHKGLRPLHPLVRLSGWGNGKEKRKATNAHPVFRPDTAFVA